MLIQSSKKTNWFHIAILLVVTLGALYSIKQAFAKPLVEWQRFNEVRAAQISELTE